MRFNPQTRVFFSIVVCFIGRYFKTAALVLAGVHWLSPAHSAAPQCLDLFEFHEISPLKAPYVFRVRTAEEDLVYKIYLGENSHRTAIEAESLSFFADLVSHARPNSKIRPIQVEEVTSTNAFGLLESVRREHNVPASEPISALVTRYAKGEEVVKLMDNLDVPYEAKLRLLEDFVTDMEAVIRWLDIHPEYRYKGSRVIVSEQKFDPPEIYEFISFNGVVEYSLRMYVLQLENPRFSGVELWLDGFSNLSLDGNGRMILFDPY